MVKRNKIHPLDRPALREGFSLDIETVISGVTVLSDMHDELPDWTRDREKSAGDIKDTREWLLKKSDAERFIRSVGILATLDADKLDDLIEAKRTTQG